MEINKELKDAICKKYLSGKINIRVNESNATPMDYVKAYWVRLITLGVINFRVLDDSIFKITEEIINENKNIWL